MTPGVRPTLDEIRRLTDTPSGADIALPKGGIVRFSSKARPPSSPAMLMRSPLFKTFLAALPLIFVAAIALNFVDKTGPMVGFIVSVAVLLGLLAWLYFIGKRD